MLLTSVPAPVRGDEPSGVAMERLVRGRTMLWAEQRGSFGIAGR